MELIRGKQPGAIKCLVYGPEGIGKSTFASACPRPVFIDTEGSTTHMDVARTPKPTSWPLLIEQVQYFIQHNDELGTLVIDTADWAERLCIEHICAKKQLDSIESAGYGRGYVYLAEEFGRLLNLLEELKNKGVHIVITAHAILRKFEQPDEMGAYDRWELKLSKKTSPLCKEWVDMLLMANYKTLVMNVDGQGASKGKNKAQGGKRVMFTTHHPCWDAKNRHGLPDELPFEFAAIAHLFAAPQSSSVPPASPPAPIPPDDGIPQALRDLMDKDKVSEQEIMFAVASKGYYPGDTPIAKYDPAFVSGVLIAAWPQVRAMVETNRQETPF